MPVGLPKRLALIALLSATFVAHGALAGTDVLRDVIPAIATLSATWLVGVIAYPRARPGAWAWLPVTLVVSTSLLGLVYTVVTCLTAAGYAGRADFDGIVMPGVGLVMGALVKHALLLIDESRTWAAPAPSTDAMAA